MDKPVFNEVIIFAIRKEAEAANLYKVYADLVDSPNVKDMFREMREEEQRHKKLLESVKPEGISEHKLTNIPNMKISDYSTDEEFSPDMKYPDALMLAIKREERAFRLYQDLAAGCKEQELKKLFLVLAQEEAKHKLKLEDEYDKTVLTEN